MTSRILSKILYVGILMASLAMTAVQGSAQNQTDPTATPINLKDGRFESELKTWLIKNVLPINSEATPDQRQAETIEFHSHFENIKAAWIISSDSPQQPSDVLNPLSVPCYFVISQAYDSPTAKIIACKVTNATDRETGFDNVAVGKCQLLSIVAYNDGSPHWLQLNERRWQDGVKNMSATTEASVLRSNPAFEPEYLKKVGELTGIKGLYKLDPIKDFKRNEAPPPVLTGFKLTVKNKAGEPIEGVLCQTKSASAWTDASGTATLPLPEGKEFEVTISAKGYSEPQTFKVNTKKDKAKEIKLERID